MIISDALVANKTTGGVATAILSKAKLFNDNDIAVDLILDKSVDCFVVDEIKTKYGSVYTPDVELSSKDFARTWAYKETACFEKYVNYRNAIMKACSRHVYDAVYIEHYNAIEPVYFLRLHEYIPVYFYLHDTEHVFDKSERGYQTHFDPRLLDFQRLFQSYITYATHSEYNRSLISDDTVVLPLVMLEQELLEKSDCERSGVLYIGRYQERKNTSAYIDAIKQTGLPAKVMTNKNSAKKFVDRFTELGITDYDIRIDITGSEKAKFIKSCAICFHPSHGESYGLAVYESCGHMPVVVYDRPWTNNFNFSSVIRTDDPISVITTKYGEDGDLDGVRQHDNRAKRAWLDSIVDMTKPERKAFAKVKEWDNFWLDDYFTSLREKISIDDWQSVMNNRIIFNIHHTLDRTWFSTEKKKPAEADSLFDF